MADTHYKRRRSKFFDLQNMVRHVRRMKLHHTSESHLLDVEPTR